jgi:AcrR family transcriptional regulator
METQSPRGRLRAKTAQAILDAALDLITEGGIAALSIREIAQRIEYSPSGLYEYYASKDEILDALVKQGLTQLDEQIERSLRGKTAKQRLFEISQAYYMFARQHAQLYLLIFNHEIPVIECPKSLKQLVEIRAYRQLYACVATGLESGEFVTAPGSDMEQITYHIWALLHGLALLRLTRMNRVEGIDEISKQVMWDAIAHLSAA